MTVKRILIALALVLGLAQAQETINITAWTIGPEEASRTRATNLQAAADNMNEALEAAGADYRVKLDVTFDTTDWDSYRRRVLLAFQSGKAPDIVQSSHIDVAAWSDAGYLMPLDDVLGDYDAFSDVIPTLWGSVTYKGKRWGVPQDTEARPLYFNKVLLGKLGWSQEQIDALPDQIASGEFTWQDMFDVAKQAVDQGVVKPGYGYWHRAGNGPDYFIPYYAFGGQIEDPDTGQLIFDKQAALDMFRLFGKMADEGVLKRDLTTMDGNTWNQAVTSDQVLFVQRGTWSWAEWAQQYTADKGGEDFLWEHLGFALNPATESGDALTLSQPQAYMVSAASEHKDVAVELLSYVMDPELDAAHALGSAHLPVLQSTLSLPEFQENRYLSEVAYLLDYTTFQPLNPAFGQYANSFFRGVSAVESGQFSPEDAVEIVAEELQRSLGDDVIIR